MEERGDRSEGQIEKMKRGDVGDSGHNRDMGDSAIAEIVLPKKTEFPSQNCDTAGIVFTPILYKARICFFKKPFKDSQKRSYRLTYGKNECVLTFFYRKLEG
jgi:hypothetical protein